MDTEVVVAVVVAAAEEAVVAEARVKSTTTETGMIRPISLKKR